jgi:hypothetical protein
MGFSDDNQPPRTKNFVTLFYYIRANINLIFLHLPPTPPSYHTTGKVSINAKTEKYYSLSLRAIRSGYLLER